MYESYACWNMDLTNWMFLDRRVGGMGGKEVDPGIASRSMFRYVVVVDVSDPSTSTGCSP